MITIDDLKNFQNKSNIISNMTTTHDPLMPLLFMSQGKGARRAFKYITEDSKKNKSGGILINSDQGASKTVFSGAILMLALMHKRAY